MQKETQKAHSGQYDPLRGAATADKGRRPGSRGTRWVESAARAAGDSAPALARPVTLVATQRPLVVGAIAAALGRSPRLVVEPLDQDPAAAASEAVQRANAVVVDVEPAPAVALRLCQELRACRPAVPIVALLCCGEGPPDFHLRALRTVGIDGVLSLDQPVGQVESVLESVLRGNFALGATLGPTQAAALGIGRDRRRVRPGAQGEERPVTARDAELLCLLKEGRSNAEIGARLHLSQSTVKDLVGAWAARAGVEGRVRLAVWADRQGF